MKKYIILYEHSYDKLETRVAECIEEGHYKPQGGIAIRPEYDEERIDRFNTGHDPYIEKKVAFLQAMVLKEKS